MSETPAESRVVPEISNIYPDFLPSASVPALITGEHFDGEQVEVVCWQAPYDRELIRQTASGLGDGPIPELPAQPPQDAQRVEILDCQPQVIVARLQGSIVWVGNAGIWSRPYLINVAKPFWLSHESVNAGQLVHVAGRCLRPESRGVSNAFWKAKAGIDGHIVLRNGPHTFFVDAEIEGRSTQWIHDPRLIYFRVPADIPLGTCQVYLHNGRGGSHGWVCAGSLEVTPRAAEPPVVNVRDFGATGDGMHDDRPALEAAMGALQTGGVVYLPPGTYRVEATLCLLPGVRLHGAGRENTIIRGCGYRPPEPPAAVVRLTDATGLDELTVCGAVSEGVACSREERSDMSNDGMIRIEPTQPGEEVHDVSIFSCRIRALEEDPETRETLYLKAIHVGHDCFGRCARVSINNNEIYGSLFFWRARWIEIIRNKWYDTTPTILVSIHGWATDSLLDSNVFTETPGRLCFYPIRHCLIRHNEIHGAFKGSWTNAEEVYLLHGIYENYFGEPYERTTGEATAARPDSLTDASQEWPADMHRDSVLLITAGRGFGQYRTVVGNTATMLQLDRPWLVQPDNTSQYVVGRMYLENDFFANLNDTPLRTSLWMDCIATVLDRHRCEHSKGIDICATGNAFKNRGFHPAWYNMIHNCWMDGAAVSLLSTPPPGKPHKGVLMFGNFVTGNRIRQPHMRRTGSERSTSAAAGITASGEQSHTIISGNAISCTYVGIHFRRGAGNAIIDSNRFDNVDLPILQDRDNSSGNCLINGNRLIRVSAEGREETTL